MLRRWGIVSDMDLITVCLFDLPIIWRLQLLVSSVSICEESCGDPHGLHLQYEEDFHLFITHTDWDCYFSISFQYIFVLH